MSSSSRRALLSSIAASVSVVAGCGETEPPNADTNTRTPTRSPTSSPTGTPTDEPTETPIGSECDRRWDPSVRWSTSREQRIYRPTVADGTIYFASRDQHLYAVSTDDGRTVWRIEHDITPHNAPVVSDGLVTYVGSVRAGAFDAASGRREWSFTPPGKRAKSAKKFGDDGETVYVGVTNHSSLHEYVDDPYDRMYALTRDGGEQRWSISFSESSDTHLPPQDVAVWNDRVFVTIGDRNGSLVALDAADGEELWRQSIRGSPNPPVTADGNVYQDIRNSVVALDASTGESLWTADSTRPPATGDGSVYTLEDGVLRAHDATDGAVRWENEVPGDSGSRPAHVGGIVYAKVGSPDRGLAAFDAEQGCRLGTFELARAHPTRPAADAETLYVGINPIGDNGESRLAAISWGDSS